MGLTGNHLRAARALLGIDQGQLSELAAVSINTVRNMEACGEEPIGGYPSTRDKVQRALETLGIEFTNGKTPGVKLVRRHNTTATSKSDSVSHRRRQSKSHRRR
jgi:hypothetical protein